MRTLAILAAFALSATALAGCVGSLQPGDELDQTGAATTGTPSAGGGATNAAQYKVLLPLNGTVKVDGPQWVQAGADVPVSFTDPKNAKGALTYTWLAGPYPGTTTVQNVFVDTGSDPKEYIPGNGASESVVYQKSGIYPIHCHPHPWMRHNVTVVDGIPATTIEVLIVDGEKLDQYRYFPENVMVGAGSTVVYKNVGALPHTATSIGAQGPALKKLPLTAANGTIKAEGEGWQRVMAVVQDSEGRFGAVPGSVYVTATLPTFKEQSFPVEFPVGAGPLAGTPVEEQTPPQEFPVTLEQAAVVTLNYTFQDALAANGVPENLAQVEIHFFKQGETQDTLTDDAATAGTQSGKAAKGTYILRVIPKQGVQITGTIVVSGVYELVPPPIDAPKAPANDGHGGPGHTH